MYQWIEEKQGDSNFSYRVGWSSEIHDSGGFYDQSHAYSNPNEMKYRNLTLDADVKLGEFHLSSDQIN